MNELLTDVSVEIRALACRLTLLAFAEGEADEIGSSNTGALEAVRQGQQNRRGRGNNNNRKSHNPLSRSFESNGPDVKIRGTPAHIAEKYLTLARDAQSSGDPVLAENYLQHAEHYSRIIMAYREQLQQQGGDMANGNGQRMRGPARWRRASATMTAATTCWTTAFRSRRCRSSMASRQGQPHQQSRHSGYDANRDRPFRRDQNRDQNRFRDRDRTNDRGDRGDRGDRRSRPRRSWRSRPPAGRGPPQPGAPQDRQPDAPAEAGGGGGGEPRRRDRFQQPHEQPEFLRRPVRRSQRARAARAGHARQGRAARRARR